MIPRRSLPLSHHPPHRTIRPSRPRTPTLPHNPIPLFLINRRRLPMPPLLQLMTIPIPTEPPTLQPRLPPLLHLQRNLLIAPPMHKPHYKQQQRNPNPDRDADDAARGDRVELLAVEFHAWVADVGPGPGGFVCVAVDSEGCVAEPRGRDGGGGALMP